MYTFKPKRENRAHIVIPTILILISFVCVIASQTGTLLPPSLMQFVAVLAIAVAIHTITRFSMTSFVYEANDETKILSISKVMGRKSALAAAIDYNDIISIDKKEKGYDPKKKYGKAYKVHNFCLNIYPQNAYYLICDIEGADIAVIIEADNELLKHLK